MEARSQLRHRPIRRGLSIYHSRGGRSKIDRLASRAAYNEMMPLRRVPAAVLLLCLRSLRAVFLRRAAPPDHPSGRPQTRRNRSLVTATATALSAVIAAAVRRRPGFQRHRRHDPRPGQRREEQDHRVQGRPRLTSCSASPPISASSGCIPWCATRPSTWSPTAPISSSTSRPRTASSVGRTTSSEPSTNKLENLRPAALSGSPDGAAHRPRQRQGPAREFHRRGQRLLHPAR